MFYKIDIRKRIDRTLTHLLQTFCIYFENDNYKTEFDVPTGDKELQKFFIDKIKEHRDEYTDECIYDEDLVKTGDCVVEILPFAVIPEWINENQYIKI